MDGLNPAGFAPQRLARLARHLENYVVRGEVPGVAARLTRRGVTGFDFSAGLRDPEAGDPMRADTLVQIASMTKPIVAAAAMTLYEEGAFDLNTPIARFAPAFREVRVCAAEQAAEPGDEPALEALAGPITFRHLFTHTSGLGYGWGNDAFDRALRALQERMKAAGTPVTNETLLDALPALPFAFQPGTRWRYGLSIDVLGALLERITAQPLDVILRQRVFEPLGMNDTGFWVPIERHGRLAVVYGDYPPARSIRRLAEIQPPAERPVLLSGGGGLVSTLNDYARFATMLALGGAVDGARVLSPATVALFARNQMAAHLTMEGMTPEDPRHAGYGYSLGTRVLVDVAASGRAGNRGEFGWDGAFNTYFFVDPVEAMAAVLIVQRLPFGVFDLHNEFKILTYQALGAG
ncbi:MAG: beta-lactamase family protein [Thermoflexales bacterium]|nr:beta-lactamase family protein [Thermoflexales bacterium]